MLTLKKGQAELVLAPENGGSVSAFRCNGMDILRPFDPAKGMNAPATEYAAFPLFPFSGRIAHGRFSFDGNEYQLPQNFPPEPHAIHGQGWQSKWEIASTTVDTTTLAFRHDGSIWPWAYHATQIFTLTQTGLSVMLTLTNLSNRPMPAGIGWHPYFPSDDAQLICDVSAIWRSSEDMIPGASSPLSQTSDLTSPRDVSDLNLDNAFAAGDIGNRICWPSKNISIEMTATNTLRHLIVYTPQGEDFFCVEPVSHSPDAINSSEPASVNGLKILSPGETLSGLIYLSVED